MNATFLLMIGLTLPSPQDTEEARRAIEIVRQADGKVVFDDKTPGKQVIAINL